MATKIISTVSQLNLFEYYGDNVEGTINYRAIDSVEMFTERMLTADGAELTRQKVLSVALRGGKVKQFIGHTDILLDALKKLRTGLARYGGA